LAAALTECERAMPADEWARGGFEKELRTALPEVQIIGEKSPRLWNTVSVIMPEASDCRQRWVVKLDKLGFAVSTGSACASGKERPSHVLAAMGYSADEAGRALRFSAGWETTDEQWRELLEGLVKAAKELVAEPAA
jgi:cysteine desulfurase